MKLQRIVSLGERAATDVAATAQATESRNAGAQSRAKERGAATGAVEGGSAFGEGTRPNSTPAGQFGWGGGRSPLPLPDQKLPVVMFHVMVPFLIGPMTVLSYSRVAGL